MANKYTYSVPFTVEQLAADYASGMTQAEIGKKWGVSQKVVWRAMTRCGIPTRIAAARNQKGPANNNWRGGLYLQPEKARKAPYASAGYWLEQAPGHPHANKAGYVYVHVRNALKAAGLDALPEGHCVHHVNLRKDDNRPENLEICSHKQHQRYHSQLEELAVKLLLDTGRLRFEPGVGYVEA